MAFKTTPQRLLSGERFTIIRNDGNYEWIVIYKFRNFNPDPANPDWYILGQLCESKNEIILKEQNDRKFKASIISTDHFFINIIGMTSTTMECVPYSQIVFMADIPELIAKNPVK